MTSSSLRRRVEAVSGGRSHVRLPAGLKQEVVAYARARRSRGASWRVIAAEVGVSDKRLYAWLHGSASSLAKRPQMIPVRVTARAVAVPVAARREIIVRGPCGVTIEGMDWRDVAELLSELSS